MLVNLRLAIKGEVVLTQELVNCLDWLRKEKPDVGADDLRHCWPGMKLGEYAGDFGLLSTQRYFAAAQLHVIIFQMIHPPDRLAVRVQDPYEEMYYLELNKGHVYSLLDRNYPHCLTSPDAKRDLLHALPDTCTFVIDKTVRRRKRFVVQRLTNGPVQYSTASW